MIDVSVVIPVYNTEKYIIECIESVLANKEVKYEIICIDDGSTDSSLELLQDLAEKNDSIKVFKQENKGQSAARNRAIQESSGKYIYFLDSDDKIGKDALKRLFDYLERDNLDVLYFSGSSFYETEELSKKFKNFDMAYQRSGVYEGFSSGLELLQQLWKQKDFSVSPCIQIIRKEFLQKYDISFYEGIIHEDNLFTFQIIINAERAKCVNDIFFYRRVRESSIMTREITYKNLFGYFICFKKMIDYVYGSRIKPEEEYIVDAVLRSVKFHVRRNYNLIDKEEREKFYRQLNIGERIFFKSIILQEIETEIRNKRKIKDLEAIKTSISYRVGKLITWPFRKVKTIIVKIWLTHRR